jgi:hypothetical protein
MTQQNLKPPSPAMEQLIGKMIAEADFRQQLIDDPAAAVKASGLQLTSEEMEAVTSTSREEREQMLGQLGDRTAPWTWQPPPVTINVSW